MDKTPLIAEMVDEGDYYFLSRPRRFGKSLLLDTLWALFECDEPLFRGLYIHDHWDWSDPHPVIHLSFDGKHDEPGELAGSVHVQLTHNERRVGLESSTGIESGPDRLKDLIGRMHAKTGKGVVVLVDEYDKPILDVLEDPVRARANRDYLRSLYGIVKGSARQVRFMFVTGVSMFSKVRLFSGLNNLVNISLDPRFATVCGYTDTELDTVFAPELAGLDRDEVRRWYNGYSWGGEKVYNPYDVLLLFRFRAFDPHWYETGTADFLFRVMNERGVSPMEVEGRLAEGDLVSTFEVDDIATDALLFQTGYLTITGKERRDQRTFYRLDYPNFEVRMSLNIGLLRHLGGRGLAFREHTDDLCDLLVANDFDAAGRHLKAFLASIPYQWPATADLTRYEAWYAGILYACFRAKGVDLRLEESTARGRADMVLLHGGQVFVMEFKVTEEAEKAESATAGALRQLRERGYADKYLDTGQPVHLLALVFGQKERNLISIHAERH